MNHSPYEPRCGKVRHPSYKVAVTNLHRAARNHDRNGRDRQTLRVYLCHRCGGYHTGNADVDALRSARRTRQRPPRDEDADDE